MQQGYYSAAWSDIKNSPGWFGKICLMGLVNFIPVFGLMVCYGYSFGWARDIAWNVHQPMPARLFGNEDGKLYSRGASAWLILFIVSAVFGVFSLFAGDSSILNLAISAAMVFVTVFACVGVMRMAIYGRLSAGFQVKKIWAMVSHDSNGLLRIVGMVVLLTLIVGLIVFVMIFAVLLIIFAVGAALGVSAGLDISAISHQLQYGLTDAYYLGSLFSVLAPVIGIACLLFLAIFYIASVAGCWIDLMMARALGYWTRQFDVASWRGQDDPMPFEVKSAADAAAAAAANAAAVASAAAAADAAAAANNGQIANQAPQPQPTAQQPTAQQPYAQQPTTQPQPAPQSPAADPSQAAAPVADPAVTGAVCPNCGNPRPSSDSKFCPYCGLPLK